MEDPWVNAWGDPQKSSSETTSNPQLAANWASSSKFITDDQADIAIPSWEADTGAIWDDSPDLQKDLWSGENRVSQLWATPTLDSIGFAKPSQEVQSNISLHAKSRSPSPSPREPEIPIVIEEPKASLGFEETVVDSDTTHSASDEQEEPVTPKRTDTAFAEAEISIEEIGENKEEEQLGESSPDLDGFGTFEVATNNDSQSDLWPPPKSDFSQIEQTEAWGTSWKEQVEDTDDSDSEALDEWELAKRQKEIQDRYVPPDLLDSILRRFNEFSGEYWPDDESDEPSRPFQHDRSDLAERLGITAVVNNLIPPDLTLPVPTPFAKTFISKEAMDSLKLTRHHLITRNSPLAVYMNSKGSLSWEAAIKSKPDVTEADVIPSGWRIMPKEIGEQQQSTSDTKKKSGTGLLSFFGRKSLGNAPASGSTSPVRSATPGQASPQSSKATSPRPSVDTNTGGSVKETDMTLSATLAAVAEVSSPSKADTAKAAHDVEEPLQTPSAVSRFFGRFSRSNKSNTNSRNSIALSTDDLEFLSDIVPNANDEMDQIDQLDALSNMIRAPPVPTKLPPPLAPPPRAPPLSKPLSPPPFVSSQSLTPTMQHPSAGSRLSSMQESIESQLFTLDQGFSALQPQLKRASLETAPSPHLATPPHQPPVPPILPPALPPPLMPKPTISQRQQPAAQPIMTAPAQPASLFDDDDFSDFQTSPKVASVLSNSLDSAFVSFENAPAHPPKTQSTASDDFGDLVSPEPPRVPDKPQPIPKSPFPPPPGSSMLLPPPSSLIPRAPSIKSPSPPKQPSIHDRRSSRQADSHKRTLSLLETAAARGKWPAPPSPLPNAIPPPDSKVKSDLFDIFDDEPSELLHTTTTNPSQGLTLTANPISPATSLSLPSSGIQANENSTRIGLGTHFDKSGMNGKPLPPPTISPPPQHVKPASPSPPLQPQAHQNPHPQWKILSPPTSRPLSSNQAFPNISNFGNKGGGGSRSVTPILHAPQQQNSATNPIASVFGSSAPFIPQTSNSVSPNKSTIGAGSGGGKLSAQDLSFFESL